MFAEARLEIVERRLNLSEVLAVSNRIYDFAGWQAVRFGASGYVAWKESTAREFYRLMLPGTDILSGGICL